MFVSSVKTLIVLVSSIIISISYADFRKIIDIIIVNNNVSGPKIDPWGTPLFIGKLKTTYRCVNCILLYNVNPTQFSCQ